VPLSSSSLLSLVVRCCCSSLSLFFVVSLLSRLVILSCCRLCPRHHPSGTSISVTESCMILPFGRFRESSTLQKVCQSRCLRRQAARSKECKFPWCEAPSHLYLASCDRRTPFSCRPLVDMLLTSQSAFRYSTLLLCFALRLKVMRARRLGAPKEK